MNIERKQWLEVYEEVDTELTNKGSINKRKDFKVLNRKKNSGFILDPTIRFENWEQQPRLLMKGNKKYIIKKMIIIQNNSKFYSYRVDEGNHPKVFSRYLEGAKFK